GDQSGVSTYGQNDRDDVSNSSPLVSPSTTINVPHELNSIDVGVPLSTIGDLHKLINDIEVGKHDELLCGMTNDDCMKTLDALGSICNFIQANHDNDYVIPCKVSHADDSINLNVDESTIPSDPIIQSVDINTKSTSYVGVAGVSAKDQLKVNSNFYTLVAHPVFDGVNVSIPRKVIKKEQLGETWAKKHYDEFQRGSFARCIIKVNSEADLVDVVTIGIPSLFGDGFTEEIIRVKYEWRPPRCDICKIFGHVHDYCPKKVMTPHIVTTSNIGTPTVEKTNYGFQMVGNSSKKDNIYMSNSFFALYNKEEDVENMHDDSANLIQNTKAGESLSFMASAG
nr:zinc knuckle CX2CX4HX4C [Tanacetum cinerariifolium]